MVLHHLYQSESVASVAGRFFKANKKKINAFSQHRKVAAEVLVVGHCGW